MSNENENPTPESGEEGKAADTPAEPTPPPAEEQAAATEEAAEPNKIMAMINNLRESNPKAFYGGIAGVVVVLFLIIKMMGGSSVSQVQAPAIQIGQTYTLVNPNVSGGGDVLLLQAPGRMGATDPELREKEQVCVVDAGTPAKVLEETVVSYVKYVQVEPLEGDCAGKKGWTITINLKTR